LGLRKKKEVYLNNYVLEEEKEGERILLETKAKRIGIFLLPKQ